MGGSLVIHPLVFLINTLFTLYLTVLLLRLLLQIVRADFYNPISQFITKVTHPALRHLRQVIPSYGQLDLSCLLLLFALQACGILLILLILGIGVSFWELLVWTLVKLALMTLNLYFFLILVIAIMSWVAPHSNHPATQVLLQLTDPILRPARRIIPPIAGIDLSPLAVVILIQMINLIVQNFLMTTAPPPVYLF